MSRTGDGCTLALEDLAAARAEVEQLKAERNAALSTLASVAEILAPLRPLEPVATPGPWCWWTSNSHRRLSSDATGKDGDVASGAVHRDGWTDITIKQPDQDLIAAARNALPALLALVLPTGPIVQALQVPTPAEPVPHPPGEPTPSRVAILFRDKPAEEGKP
jgi:hypothetical protein